MNQKAKLPSMTPKKGEKLFGLWYINPEGHILISKHKSEQAAHDKGIKLYRHEFCFYVRPLHLGPKT